MNEYLLFVDTETTGLPVHWGRPYAAEHNWPYVAQLAWEIYSPEGELLKAENHYLHVPPDRMRKSAVAIHGLTADFLNTHGEAPAPVLAQLAADLRRYQPRVVGHFMRFDFHVLGAAFLRAGLPNPLPALPTFCTMLVSPPPPFSPTERRHMRLGELHQYLFREPMHRQHDAEVDAAATARCFFELRRRGELPPDVLTGQKPLTAPPARPRRAWLWWLILGLVLAAALAVLFVSRASARSAPVVRGPGLKPWAMERQVSTMLFPDNGKAAD